MDDPVLRVLTGLGARRRPAADASLRSEMTDTPSSVDKTSILPSIVREIPPQERAAQATDAPDDVVAPSAQPAEQLGFQMRFEAGRALLSLENRECDSGVVVRRALFEVPEVAFPLAVSGGALRFQNKRLILRAVELAVSWEALFVVESLRSSGLTLVRERARAGGLELLVEVDGPSGPVPVRARCVFAPVGGGGVALILHEVIGFGSLPRPRLDLAPALLDALAFPGGLPARAMIRRADPFRAVFSRLLPRYGWKVPGLGEVQVHEVVLGKGEVVLRAWSGTAPEGWKAPKNLRRGPIEETIALAIFADSLVAAADDAARTKLIDRLIDDNALPRTAIPFAAELLRRDPRRRADGDDLVERALAKDAEHLGLLAAWADAEHIDPRERANRLLKLSSVADADDEPWVAARAALAAGQLAKGCGDLPLAVAAAEAAVTADPSLAEAGILLSRLLVASDDKVRALVAGRSALERAGAGSLLEPLAFLKAADAFAVELAAVALEVEGPEAARLLLRRALRTRDTPAALVPLVELEIDVFNFERAAEGLTRLLIIAADVPALQKEVELLAARLAEARGDKDTARSHLMRARVIDPQDPRVALRLARHYDDVGDLDQALATLQNVIGDSDGNAVDTADTADTADAAGAADAADAAGAADARASVFFAARLLVARARLNPKSSDAQRARALLARLHPDPATLRVDAEARALLDDTAPLARLMLEDATAADPRAAASSRINAARLFMAAGQIDDAAGAAAAAFGHDPTAVGDLLIEHAALPDFTERLGSALHAAGADLGDTHTLARRLASMRRPTDGCSLIKHHGDRESRELRSAFAKDAGDVEAEIRERSALLELTLGAPGQMAQRLRLAVLLERAGRVHEAADAWAATGADADGVAWLRTAVATADGERLAAVLVRDDVDLAGVDSALLRLTIDHMQDQTARRRLLATLASRNEAVADVERWLDAARSLPKDAAALAFVDAARRSHRLNWLLEGVAQLQALGESARALLCLNDAIAGGGALACRAVHEAALTIAIDLDDAGSLEARVTDLLASIDVEASDRRALHIRRVEAHGAHRAQPGRAAAEEQAIAAWLDESPTDIEALSRLITRLTEPTRDHNALAVAVVRMEQARAAGIGEEAQDLLVVVADAALDRGAACEVQARELLLGFSLESPVRERTQRRLIDLCVRDGNFDRAVELLHSLVQIAKGRAVPATDVPPSPAAAAELAALCLRIADLEESERNNPGNAARALEELLVHAPEDAAASRRLLRLLRDQNDDDALGRECLRRAGWVPQSAERTDLLVQAGQIALQNGRRADARRIWLSALSFRPFSKDALDRLLVLATETGSSRTAIRAHLAAARILEAEFPADATRQAAEAGGLLAGVMHRVRLAVVAFAFAERIGIERGIDDDGAHSRMLVELFRTLGDGKNARLRLDRLLHQAEGRERARLLEARADVEANFFSNIAASIADRRAALAVDPSFSTAARALVRLLRSQGDFRPAIDVERSHADAALSGEARGLTYARLAGVAAVELADPALVDELCLVSLSLREDLEVRRRLVVAREALAALTEPPTHFAISRTVDALLGLLSQPGLSAQEILERALRTASLQNQLGDRAAAATTLREAIAHDDVASLPSSHARRAEAHAELADVLASSGHLHEAARLLVSLMANNDDVSASLGTRTAILERAAMWFDQAGAQSLQSAGDGAASDDAANSAALALNTLVDAAASAPLSDSAERTRARLAEELSRHDVAVISLESLISRNIEVTVSARRLAQVCETLGDQAKALYAWQLRLKDSADDEEALLALERLSSALGEAVALRAASEQLVKRGVGSPQERAARALIVAYAARDIDGDAARALHWFETARALASTRRIRSDAYAAAKDLDDDVTLSILDDMHVNGDVLASDERRRRASLRLRTVDGDVERALDDVVAVLDAGVEGVDDLLDLIAGRDPRLLLQAALHSPQHPSLRHALHDLHDPRLDDDGIFALANRRDDTEAIRAASRRDRKAGRCTDGADRLIALAEHRAASADARATATETRQLIEDAAVLAMDAGGTAVLERLDVLLPAFRRNPALRDGGLTALRDIEAWPAIVVILEDAVIVEDGLPERRALRLQLVSVLRDGVESTQNEERAAVHLQQLVDEDDGDREAWGELFECLDRLKDTDRLQRALGLRAEKADGIERRELVRRRVELLLSIERGPEGLATLQSVRAVNDDDALQQLERRLHLNSDGDGPPAALACFLDAEIKRAQLPRAAGSQLPAASTAREVNELLSLPAEVVPAGARVRAHLLALNETEAPADTVNAILFGDRPTATSSLLSSRIIEMITAEAAAVLAQVGPKHVSGLVAALAAAAPRLGSISALTLADALFAVADTNADIRAALVTSFGSSSAARRWRTRGPRAVDVDANRLPAPLAAALLFRRAARIANQPALQATAAELGLARVVDFVDVGYRQSLVARASAALCLQAASNDGTLGLLRHGDPRGLARCEAAPSSHIARRARTLPLTLRRLPARLFMATHLGDDGQTAAELGTALDVAVANSQALMVGRALDALFVLRTPSAAELVQRADAAWALGASDACDWCERGADATAATSLSTTENHHADSTRLRRRAIEGYLRAGHTAGLQRSLLALAKHAQTGPDGDALRAEALSTAEAARLSDVADAIMAEAAEHLSNADERVAALRRRAAMRIQARDPHGAFHVLTAGARSLFADPAAAAALRNDAYDVAAAHALVDAMLEVVDDDLARAGLLAVLGDRQGARSLASTLPGAAALWLVAECAVADGDTAAAERALQLLADCGAAEDSVLTGLVESSRRSGNVDDAVKWSLDLARSSPTPQRLCLLVDCLADERVSVEMRSHAVQVLLAFDALSADQAVWVASAAVDVANSTSDLPLRRQARTSLATLKNSDEAWATCFAHDLDEGEASEVAVALRPLLARRGVMAALVSSITMTRARALGAALRVLIRGGDAVLVIESIGSIGSIGSIKATSDDGASHPWPLTDAIAAALEVSGRNREAAELLASAIGDDRGAEGFPLQRFRLRASELFIEAAAAGAAARLLLGLGRGELDEAVLLHTSTVVDQSAREGAMGDASQLAAHIARLSGKDEFVVRALACADAAGGDTALAIGSWRMRAQDTRALAVLAHHTLEGSAAQGYFAAWHALRAGVRSFANHAPIDFQFITRMGEQTGVTVPPVSSTTLARARTNNRAGRQAAWSLMSSDIAATDSVGAARLLVRAGVPMSAAPLEVRLAADPELTDLASRAAAITAGLADVPPWRRTVVAAAFDLCSAHGATTAAQRRAVLLLVPRPVSALEAAIDAVELGEAVDVKALLKSLKRNPTPATRAAAAAVLLGLGHRELATMLLPTLSETPRVSDEARLGALHDQAGDDLDGLGKLRLSQVQGPRIDVEERIAAIAARLGRTDLLAESLLRQARLTAATEERSALLARRGAALVATRPHAAHLAACAAFHGNNTEAHARLVVTCAERIDDPVLLEAALRCWHDCAVLDDDKHDAALRRAQLLARKMLRPEEALEVLDNALSAALSVALFSERAAIQNELLNDPAGAATSILAAVEFIGDATDARVSLLRFRAVDYLKQEGSSASIELAIYTLCEAAEQSDATALVAAETLARTKPGIGLVRVLELRLHETDDVGARQVLVLERARLLAEVDDKTAAITLLEIQAIEDDIDLGARMQLASWYLDDLRTLDAAHAFASAARIPGLPAAVRGPPAREAASLLAASGDLERAGALAEIAVAAGIYDLELLAIAEAWQRGQQNWAAVEELLGHAIEQVSDHRREAQMWLERAIVRRDHLADEPGTKRAIYRVLELVIDHPGALQMLREEAQRSGTWGPLRMALFRATETSSDQVQQLGWLREIACIDADELGDNKAGQAAIDRALTLAPDDPKALALKATLMVRVGQVEGLPMLMHRLEKLGVIDLPGLVHLTHGDALLLTGDRRGSKASFRRATGDPETAARAWDRLIDIADDLAEALALFAEARRVTTDNKRCTQLLRKEQQLRTKVGDEDGAAAVAEQLLRLEPDDAEALMTVRASMTRQRKLMNLTPYLLGWARAVDAATQAPERARRLSEVGCFTLDELGQEATARALFEEALALQVDQPVSLQRLADIAWGSRDDERALELLDQMSQDQWTATPDDQGRARSVDELFFRRACCAYALGHADVRERLRQVMRQNSNHIGALEMLARVAFDNHDDDAAEMFLESLSRAIMPLEHPAKLANVLVDLALLRSRRHQFDDAAAAAERAFELDASNPTVLETLAATRENSGRFIEAAEAWRGVAALKSGKERIRALERRAQALASGRKDADAANAWLELYEESADVRYQSQAQELALRCGDVDLIKRLLRANLDKHDPVQALHTALAAMAVAPLDEESCRLALVAADQCNRPDAAVDIAEARLQKATNPKEVQQVALAAGRIARDQLNDEHRAAALMYQAHQANAEDLQVRFELTELYARIPRLTSHAVTGVLQLLRRTPDDPRIYRLAASLSDSQGQSERAFAMHAIEAVLSGNGRAQDFVGAVVGTSQVLPLDREAISSRLAPTGWNNPGQQLISLLGVHLEQALCRPAPPLDTKSLALASPKSLALTERIERLLPGRTVQLLVADIDRPTLFVDNDARVVLPRDLLANESALLAAVARGVGMIRLGAAVTEFVMPGQEQDLLDLLRSALLDEGARDPRAELLVMDLSDSEMESARKLMKQVLENPDLSGTLQILMRACDRFALVASGSPLGALAASALPTLLKEPPPRVMAMMQSSVRALELCAFAARDNAWLMRRQHGLSTNSNADQTDRGFASDS